MLGDAEYIADTLLIEKIAKLEAVDELVKTADVSDILSGVASSITSYVQGVLPAASSTGSLLETVIKVMESGILFKIHPVLGIIDVIAQTFFNVSATSLLIQAFNVVKPMLMSGKQVTTEQVNAAAQSISKTATASLQDLHELNGQLTKIAFLGDLFKPTTGGAIVPSGKEHILYRIFGFLSPSQKSNILFGFIAWILKTSLLGFGLLAIGGAAAGFFGMKPTNPFGGTAPTTAPSALTTKIPEIAGPSSSAKWGTQFFANDKQNAWTVPLNGKSPQDVLVGWTIKAYPELSKYKSVITSNPDFKAVLRTFSQSITGNSILIPIGYNRPIDFIDKFVNSVFDDIKETNDEL